MNKIATGIFFVTTLIFGGLYMTKGPAPEPIEVKNPLNQELKSERDKLLTKNSKLEKEVQALKDQLQLARKATAKAQEDRVAAVNAPKAEIASTERKTQNPFQRVMDDPKVQEMMKKRRNQMIEGRYGYLFKKLDLSEADKEAFMELLGERSMVQMSSRMRGFANGDDEEAKQKAEQEREESLSKINNEISDLLGDNYSTYEDYSEKRREYDYVSGLNRALGDSSLSDDQTDKLASLMKDTKDSYQFSNEKLNDSSNPWAAYSLNKEERAEYVKELEVRDELVLEESAGFLDESQQEALKKQQARDRERLLNGRRGFFGGRSRR